MKSVLVVGGISYDTIIDLEALPPPVPATVFSKKMRQTVGSTGAGKALNLCRLGFATTLHTMIGADEAGTAVRNYFAEQPLTFIGEHDPRGTEQHTNLMDRQGGRISIYTAYSTFEPLVDHGALGALIQQSDFIVLNIINYCRYLIPILRHHNKPIWCDLHDYDPGNSYYEGFATAADYVFLSSEKLPDYKATMQQLMARGKQLVVCTHGSAGSTALTNEGEWIETPIIQREAFVDSNGAGDSFFAGFLYGYAQGYPIRRCLELATLNGGLCVISPELFHPDLSPALLEAEHQQYFQNPVPNRSSYDGGM
jgi:sugar/nucleoside kinase (ribokinase family)